MPSRLETIEKLATAGARPIDSFQATAKVMLNISRVDLFRVRRHV
ncbi:hypothetical protein SM11_pC0406 (plasmid) [Sinorhizobium meliloti SM11]|uniref:Uncharacterized protein n=1 Tax=Sinorhizobium meliloti (strain SM11) TaxID=707241 RepID=F7XCR9_SINMM|nr:hypothetical protein SM11_pC0406 [Sinorhizobium meliloti SM11]